MKNSAAGLTSIIRPNNAPEPASIVRPSPSSFASAAARHNRAATNRKAVMVSLARTGT